MRTKLLLTVLAASSIVAGAQTRTVVGTIVDASTDVPLSGAVVTAPDQTAGVTSGYDGQFTLTLPDNERSVAVTLPGYESQLVTVGADGRVEVRLLSVPTNEDLGIDYYGDTQDLIFEESLLEDDNDNLQSIAALTGANDNLYYNAASYNFGPMYFRYRGYDSQYQTVYINGVQMNDLIRGRFNFSSLLGMTSRAFRNKATAVGMDASNYGFGDIGGTVNYSTITEQYAPGFNGSLAYTNSSYMFRAMAAYSTGLNKHGWAFTVSAIGRYANEGVVAGTFYNSGGLFMSIEKYFNDKNQLVLTAWGGPTQRATASGTYQEVFDLVGNNLYNPNWGWYQGKKRASRIVESYDPTAMLNWLYKNGNTTVNTAAAFTYNYYSSSALNYYKANDPNPTYYRYLPSNYYDDYGQPTEQSDYYTWLWQHDENFSQINWDNMYNANELTNYTNQFRPYEQQQSASYIQENRVNATSNFKLNSVVNTRLNSFMTLEGGAAFQYANSANYKTIRDLLGGEFWIDVDPFSDRDYTIAPDNLVNNYNYPDPYNHRVYKGDKFGYDYNIYAINANAWIQNRITLPRWDVNYSFKVSHTQYQRNGHMRNGRAPLTSYGKGAWQTFDNLGFKVGATFKADGHNFIQFHADYETRAPLADAIYLMPRVKNDVVANVSSEEVLSADLGYVWNYRRFRGMITGFITKTDNGIERTGYYDEQINSYTYYVLSDVKKVYKGIELALAYKITPSITATFAGNYSRFQYKNNPNGTHTYENGLYPDETRRVYLKNYYVGSTPQFCGNLALDYAAPGMWFFNVNATYQGDAYVNLSPAYHEQIKGLWALNMDLEQLEQKINELATQDKLKNAFTLNASIGKIVYVNRTVSLNFNLSVNNILNNRDVCTYAYQQGRIDTKEFNRTAYPNRYTYAQGIRVFFNVGVRF